MEPGLTTQNTDPVLVRWYTEHLDPKQQRLAAVAARVCDLWHETISDWRAHNQLLQPHFLPFHRSSQSVGAALQRRLTEHGCESADLWRVGVTLPPPCLHLALLSPLTLLSCLHPCAACVFLTTSHVDLAVLKWYSNGILLSGAFSLANPPRELR